jgi:YfiH family protein
MERITSNGLSLWQFEQLAKYPEVRHFVTDRRSDGDETPFTLSYSSHPDRAFIDANRLKLAGAIGVAANRLFFPSQVHETRIVTVTVETQKEDLMKTDALITNEKGICIAVMSADCVPVLLYDRLTKSVAAVHAGWRGTVASIVSKTIQEMITQFGTKPEDIVAAIGPSICQESYEVGAEVLEEVRRVFGTPEKLIVKTLPGKGKLDLWQANKIQLLNAGVSEHNIEIGGLCTSKNNDHFFSARKGDKGRFAAGIVLSDV